MYIRLESNVLDDPIAISKKRLKIDSVEAAYKVIRVYFRGGGARGCFRPGAGGGWGGGGGGGAWGCFHPPSGLTCPPWKLAFPICYMGIAPLPLDLYLPPPLKIAAMRLPPLEQNSEINPAHNYNHNLFT